MSESPVSNPLIAARAQVGTRRPALRQLHGLPSMPLAARLGLGTVALCALGLGGCATKAETEALEAKVAALEAQVLDLKVNSLSLVDKDGKVHASFAMRSEDGTPQLLMQDADGRNRLLARLHPDGTPILVLWGKDGKGTSYLSVPGEGPPQLMFFDKDGGQPVKLPQ